MRKVVHILNEAVVVLFRKVEIYYSDLSASKHIFGFNIIYFTSGKVNNVNNFNNIMQDGVL